MPRIRAEFAEEEEVVDPLITKELSITAKSGRDEVKVGKLLENVVKSESGSPATVELKTIEPEVRPVTIIRSVSVILAADKIEEVI